MFNAGPTTSHHWTAHWLTPMDNLTILRIPHVMHRLSLTFMVGMLNWTAEDIRLPRRIVIALPWATREPMVTKSTYCSASSMLALTMPTTDWHWNRSSFWLGVLFATMGVSFFYSSLRHIRHHIARTLHIRMNYYRRTLWRGVWICFHILCFQSIGAWRILALRIVFTWPRENLALSVHTRPQPRVYTPYDDDYTFLFYVRAT